MEIMPPGIWWWYWDVSYSSGLPIGSPSRRAMRVKCSETGLRESSSMTGLWPSARAFAATVNKDGLDEPSASGGIAVLMVVMPSLIASSAHSGPRPVVQWV